MIKLKKGDSIVYSIPNTVNVWERNGYKVVKDEVETVVINEDTEKEEIKAKLDELGIKYHPNLGIKKLRLLLP